ncbi:Imm3 family immunity protein [Paenibacillus macerans]|uniref:Imm3 family immunity protein n=1 Tax=Paenibacillus macerans TaxID=44252 RepID=UPI002E23B458|nr:Imm3 family immunity protein [Paenibacillus macerans]
MNNKYEELFESFHETYQEYKERRMNNSESLERTMDDFELIMNRGDLEKAIILISYGEFALKQPYMFYKSKDFLVEKLNEVAFDSLEQQLTIEQYNDLLTRKNNILKGIEKKPLNFNSRTFWYYEEMKNEVNSYFDAIFTPTKTANDLAEDVLKRFERDCKHTLGEKIGVYATLAERLIENNLTATEHLIHIESTLKDFNVDDVGNQLSQDEKQMLQLQIEGVLKHLGDIL